MKYQLQSILRVHVPPYFQPLLSHVSMHAHTPTCTYLSVRPSIYPHTPFPTSSVTSCETLEGQCLTWTSKYRRNDFPVGWDRTLSKLSPPPKWEELQCVKFLTYISPMASTGRKFRISYFFHVFWILSQYHQYCSLSSASRRKQWKKDLHLLTRLPCGLPKLLQVVLSSWFWFFAVNSDSFPR